MQILDAAFKMLAKYPLCDHCLGRQFALLGHGIGNEDRGHAIKLVLTLRAHALAVSGEKRGLRMLKVLALNGFFDAANAVLQQRKEQARIDSHVDRCHLCEDKFKTSMELVDKALKLLDGYECHTFLVGTEIPHEVAEREDEFKATFGVEQGENMRNEFGRVLGREISCRLNKDVDFKTPEIVVLVNPFTGFVRLQVNPLFVSGKYRKLMRGIPQSKWFCSNCRGKGCEKCGWTGKMYPESVQEIVEKPFLEATGGEDGSFHASGREDIDARMLGDGRPFVIEISQPKRRFLDLTKLEKAVNLAGRRKVQVAGLQFADRNVVRTLKKGESTQKEYRVLVEFDERVTLDELERVKKLLTNASIKQQTPLRVVHRRADMVREKYIYEVDVKKLSPKKAEMKIRCQGGLYVKELVTGDEGRTNPSVSNILGKRAKPLKLDVLKVATEN